MIVRQAPDVGAAERMAEHLSPPFARGADQLTLAFRPGSTTARGELAGYDFTEHRARFGVDAKPRYVVRTLVPVEAATVLTVTYDLNPSRPHTVAVDVPAGTPAGAAFAVPLADDASDARLRAVEVAPVPSAEGGTVAARWRLTALLGDLAALLWAVGAERDVLAEHLSRLRGQRTLAHAVGRSLDLIGADLGVRRFPPLPHGVDADTVALYHLDEAAGASAVADATALYRPGDGLPGAVAGVELGAPGRFGAGARIAGSAEITVPDDPALAVPADRSLTVELFVQADAGTGDGGRLIAKHGGPAGRETGWALSVGSFTRGIARNVRLLLADGGRTVGLFTDVPLPTDRFVHLAAVVDRAAGTARLLLDGTVRASAPLVGLRALTTAEPLRLGDPTAPRGRAFVGTVDEIRISRVARAGFAPVLGEADGGYRRRLTLFRRWTLPTPANLQAALNEATGEVAGVAEPFVLDDADTAVYGGSRALTVLPVRLHPGESMDALGRRGIKEAEGAGTADADPAFTPALLVDGTDPRAVFAPDPGGDPRRMRVGTRRALRRLLDVLAALDPPPDAPLAVIAGYRPGAGGLREVGRSLVLRHPELPADRLAALADRAGFSWVRCRQSGTEVEASVAATESVEVVAVRADPDPDLDRLGLDALVDTPLTLRTDPPPPPGSVSRWSVVHHEHGRARPLSAADRPDCTILPTETGALHVRVSVRSGGVTAVALHPLRVGVRELRPGTTLAGDGRRDVPEEVAAGDPGPPLPPSYLVPLPPDARLPTTPGADRMHPGLLDPLARFCDLLGADGQAGRVRVTAAWRPDGGALDRAGCTLVLGRAVPDAALGRVAALAHAAGFDFVAVAADALRLAHRAGAPGRIQGPVDVTTGRLSGGGDELDEGAQADFAAWPGAVPSAMVFAGPLLCVADGGSSSVSVVDPRTGAVRHCVPVGILPRAITADPDGTTVFTADWGARTVSVVDVAAGTVLRSVRVVATAPPRFVLHHPTDPLLVVLTGTEVVLLDASGRPQGPPLRLPNAVTAAAMDPGGSRVWLGLADRTLRSVTLKPVAVSPPTTLDGVAEDLAVTPDSVYVVVPGAGQVCVVDRADPAQRTVLPDTGPGPNMVAVDERAALLHIADRVDGRVRTRSLERHDPGERRSSPVPGTIADLVGRDGRVFVATVGQPPFGGTEAVGVLDPLEEHPVPHFWSLGSGLGERYSWSALPAAQAGVRLAGTVGGIARVSAERAGPVLLTARLTLPGKPPFALRIRLHPRLEELEADGRPVTVSKEQYDLAMNVLSELHPLGVEIDTTELRARVPELRAGLLDVFPEYTYPTYRRHRPVPVDRERR